MAARPPPGQKYPKARHVNVYAGLDGSIGHFVPVDEKQYRRLNMLQVRQRCVCGMCMCVWV